MKNLTILIVEDGRSQRVMLRDFLREEGYEVEEAETGEEAVNLVKERFFQPPARRLQIAGNGWNEGVGGSEGH